MYRPTYGSVPPIGDYTQLLTTQNVMDYNIECPQIYRARREERAAISHRRKLSLTQSTNSTPGVTLRSTLGEGLHLDSFTSFHTSKIPTLRQSPAYIVWPEKPPVEKQSKQQEARLEPKPSTMTGAQKDIEPCSSESSLPYVREDFWDHAVGNIRIDSQYIGSPRSDPYHSKWSRDERRCFFISDICRPPHLRENFYSSMPSRDTAEHISFRAPKHIPLKRLSVSAKKSEKDPSPPARLSRDASPPGTKRISISSKKSEKDVQSANKS